jgi:hypothetical protein
MYHKKLALILNIVQVAQAGKFIIVEKENETVLLGTIAIKMFPTGNEKLLKKPCSMIPTHSSTMSLIEQRT